MNLTNKKLKVLFVSAEVDPFAKTGGLADVAGSLPKELSLLGHDVRVVMPRYGIINAENAAYVSDFPVELGNRKETCIIKESSIYDTDKNAIPVYFIENYNYFDRTEIYCYSDDAQRFILLCKAALEMLPAIGFKPDIIHCNDWHTGPICLMLKEKFAEDNFYKDIATVYTIHNLEYQGNFGVEVTEFLNLKDGFFNFEKTEFYGMFSFMKAGLVYSDIINTVSKHYAQEILTPSYGEKMEGVLLSRKEDLFGIINGISYDEFDPSRDQSLYVNFDKSCPELKVKNKSALQQELCLKQGEAPLMGVVTRFASQKGLELIFGCIEEFIKTENVQLVVLGLGENFYCESFTQLSDKYPENVAAIFEFNSELAKRIYASCDLFLMPSRFEPCGLGQIISLRYGTIPIVRATGGLAETIIDYEENNADGNGFTFAEFSVSQFKRTLERAINVYKNMPEVWEKLILKALESDFSWKKPSRAYLGLYELALEKKLKANKTYE